MAKIEYVRKVTFEVGDKAKLETAAGQIVTVTGVNGGSVGIKFSDESIAVVPQSYLTLIESWDGRVPDDIDPHTQAIDQAYARGARDTADQYEGLSGF